MGTNTICLLSPKSPILTVGWSLSIPESRILAGLMSTLISEDETFKLEWSTCMNKIFVM